MDRNDTKSTITLSNLNFHKKIIQKYQAGKTSTSRLPGMILHKERGCIIPQKISLILKFRLHLDKQNILPFLILKKISAIREMLPKLNTEKNTLQLTAKPKSAQDKGNIINTFQTTSKILHMYQVAPGLFSSERVSINRAPAVPFLKPLIFRVENVKTDSNKILKTDSNKTLKTSILDLKPASYQQAIFPASSDIATVNSRVSKSGKNIENLYLKISTREINNNWSDISSDFTFVGNENNPNYQPAFENKSPSIILDKQTKEFSLIPKDIPVLKGMLSRFNTKKHALQSILRTKNTINISEVMNLFSTELKVLQMYQVKSGFFSAGHLSASSTLLIPFLKSLIFRAENVTTDSNKILKSPILALKASFYQRTTSPIYPNTLVISQILNYENNMEVPSSHIFEEKINRRSLNLVRYSTFISGKNRLKHLPSFWDKVPGILLQDNLLFDNTNPLLNRHFFRKSARETVNRHLIKDYHVNPERDEFGSVHNTYASKTNRKGFFFHDQGHMEQEIEKIKKIVIETKESMMEKPSPVIGEADIKRFLDINRISDQVYRNIERTIRMERERRGI